MNSQLQTIFDFMLQINNVGVDFGTRILFEKINLVVKPKDKIGLAGRNGVGKSTLLKLIAGEDHPSSGSITSPKSYSIGYLPQELKIDTDETVFDEAKSALSNVEELEEKQLSITNEITERTDYESDAYMQLIDQLNQVNTQLEFFGNHNRDQKVEEILKGLGFNQKDLHSPVKSFSGGWQMRVELAKLLLVSPDLLLLDEPTNHLDIESILWLEAFLKSHKGAVMMVSHDRQFLDTITTRTVEIINQGIEDYRAPYSKFLQLREERIEKLEQAKKNQEKEIVQTKKLIEKFRAKKNKAKFAQTLIRKLDKMDMIEVDSYDKKTMNLSFQMSRRSGNEVVVVDNVSKSYGENEVIKNLSLKLLRGDKIAFVGKNGMGKTTLAKMIVKELAHEGNISLGHNVDLGYYAQHQNQTLDEEITLLETIEKEAPRDLQGKERGLLGGFLFSGDDVEKKVKVLSGGEKARLAMAKMLLHPINFLVLDEPTNHLDLQSKAILKDSVKNFEGTMVVVSHDRDFLQGLTEKVYEFTKDGIREYLGDINEFLRQRGASDFREFEKNPEKKKKIKKENDGKSSYHERKAYQKELKKLQRIQKQIENNIKELESELKNVEESLKDPKYYEEVATDSSFFKNYNEKRAEIEKLYTNFEIILEKISKHEQKSDLQ